MFPVKALVNRDNINMPGSFQGHQILPVPAPEPKTCMVADFCFIGVSLRNDRTKDESKNESYHGDVEFKHAGECCTVPWLLDYKKPDSDSSLQLNELVTARWSQRLKLT